MFYATGANTTIVKALRELTGQNIERLPFSETTPLHFRPHLGHTSRYVLAAGILIPENLSTLDTSKVLATLYGNLLDPMAACEMILREDKYARICVLGSESGIKGSYNEAYAAAKAGLHQYVINRRLLHPGQQLVCVAPTIIWDSGMTQRRDEAEKQKLFSDAVNLPKKRWCSPRDVAELIKFLLWDSSGYITNCVIPVDGGKRAGL